MSSLTLGKQSAREDNLGFSQGGYSLDHRVAMCVIMEGVKRDKSVGKRELERKIPGNRLKWRRILCSVSPPKRQFVLTICILSFPPSHLYENDIVFFFFG